MKNLNVAIPDTTDKKLDAIMERKKFKNRADCVDWIINEVHTQLSNGGE